MENIMVNEDVYICAMRGGFVSSVTICDPEYADNTIKRYRSDGKSVQVFRSREKYLEFLDKNYKSYKENLCLQREVIA